MTDNYISANQELYQQFAPTVQQTVRWRLIFCVFFFIVAAALFFTGFRLISSIPFLISLLLTRRWFKATNNPILLVTGVITEKRISPNEKPNFRLVLILEKSELLDKNGKTRDFNNYAAVHDIAVDEKTYDALQVGTTAQFIFLPEFLLAAYQVNGTLVRFPAPIDQNKENLVFE